MQRSKRTLQEFRTSLPPADVLARAKEFFTRNVSIYPAFIEKDQPTYCTFRGQGTEELVIGATAEPDGATLVRGSTYLFDTHVARFYTTLPEAAPATPAGGAA